MDVQPKLKGQTIQAQAPVTVAKERFHKDKSNGFSTFSGPWVIQDNIH